MLYSGCNYYINRGTSPEYPIGTATSMHECGDCEKLKFCKIKRDAELWEYNDEIKAQLDKDWKEMLNSTEYLLNKEKEEVYVEKQSKS